MTVGHEIKIVGRCRREHGIECSMSRRGNCLDNAAMESWFSTVKAELGETFESIHRGKEQLFDFIEVFYNQRRRHSALAMQWERSWPKCSAFLRHRG